MYILHLALKTVDFHSSQSNVCDIGLVFIIECLELNGPNGSQFTVARQRGDQLNDTACRKQVDSLQRTSIAVTVQ